MVLMEVRFRVGDEINSRREKWLDQGAPVMSKARDSAIFNSIVVNRKIIMVP
jgi:hypothetical protein